LENALEKIHSNESLDVHFGTIILRRLLVYNDGEEDLIQTIIDSGTIPRLI